MTGEPLLVIEHVTVKFGGNRALSDVDIDARAGEVTGLIGPNGAGKTTLFNVVTGMITPTNGRVLLDGNDVSRLDTHKRARLGIARTFQRLELFTDLSVRDNLRVAGEIRNTWSGFGARAGSRATGGGRSHGRINVAKETERVLDLIGLTGLADVDVSTIPTGTARVVELGRALMIQPRLLLLVEHDMALVMDVCDRIHVLDFGEIIAAGTANEVRLDPRVRDAYLGTATS